MLPDSGDGVAKQDHAPAGAEPADSGSLLKLPVTATQLGGRLLSPSAMLLLPGAAVDAMYLQIHSWNPTYQGSGVRRWDSGEWLDQRVLPGLMASELL